MAKDNNKENKGKYRSKLFFLLIFIFFITFSCRLVYEIYFASNDVVVTYTNYESGYSLDSKSKVNNVATDRISQKDFSGKEIILDQKYEKTANMESKTSDFEKDNNKLRNIITENKAVIQIENLSGLSGMRKLNITIGVSPDNFDKMVEEIKTIGLIGSFAVNKIDKTDAFKALMAEVETLKKTKESYLIIKEKGGDISDLLRIEDKILEVEKKLQDLGVNLGVYSTENSFCTVNLKLNEISKKQISMLFVLGAIKDSFLWTIAAFITSIFTLAVMFGFAALAIELYFLIKRHRPVLANSPNEVVKENEKGS